MSGNFIDNSSVLLSMDLSLLTKKALYYTGRTVRETGQALDRLGCLIQGRLAYKEQLSRHRRLMPLFDRKPKIGEGAFVAPSASVIGSVSVGNNSSVWYGAVLRGDLHSIKIGENTSIGDRVVVHVARNSLHGARELPTLIGDNVTVSQGALLHGCTVEDNAVIDVGATVMDGAVVSNNAILGAGALLTEGQRVPPGEFWAGSPAKFVRKLTEEEIASIKATADKMRQIASKHDEFHTRSAEDQERERERIWNIADNGETPPEHLY